MHERFSHPPVGLGVDGDRLHHVGVPILPTVPTSSGPQGVGGATRTAVASAPLNARFAGDFTFFLWLVIIGVVIPGLVVGGLRAGGFQFVFRGR